MTDKLPKDMNKIELLTHVSKLTQQVNEERNTVNYLRERAAHGEKDRERADRLEKDLREARGSIAGLRETLTTRMWSAGALEAENKILRDIAMKAGILPERQDLSVSAAPLDIFDAVTMRNQRDYRG